MDVNLPKKRRVALTDVSNKNKISISEGVKKKGVLPSRTGIKTATRRSARNSKRNSHVEKILPTIERLVVDKEESMIQCDDDDDDSNDYVKVEEVKEDQVEERPVRELNWVDIEAQTTCTYYLPEYVNDIFHYYKAREAVFQVDDYLSGSCEVSREMRAVLVDWLVDVQQSFELNHESLYMAVKMIDLYLSKAYMPRNKIQLVGAVALNLACKYDERVPPVVDDFVYVCDDAYNRTEFIEMEATILRTLDYDLGFPLSYTFLRRYAQCSRTSTHTLTLARYVLEMSLMSYDFIKESESLMACATLYMAMAMRRDGTWDDTLVHYTGYYPDSFLNLVVSLNNYINSPSLTDIKSIKSKYSHRVFHEVAKIRTLTENQLLQFAISCDDDS